ncbi:MAG: hypothetical protein ACP5HK_04395 [Acidilobus sp.]
MSAQPKVQKTSVIRIELTDQQYEALSKRAREAGFPSVESYVEAAITGSLPQAQQSPDVIEERIVKRVERAIQDVLNPFTQKVDELAKRLAEVQENVEELKEAMRQRPASPPLPERAQRPAAQERAGATAEQQPGALERLRRQGVVFSEDVAYMRAPDRFFAKLERLGAVVLQLPDGQAAIDPDFWRKFVTELENTKLADARQVSDKLAASMGDRASALFNRLVRGGVAVYDEDSKRWVVRTIKGREREEGGGEGEEENYL